MASSGFYFCRLLPNGGRGSPNEDEYPIVLFLVD